MDETRQAPRRISQETLNFTSMTLEEITLLHPSTQHNSDDEKLSEDLPTTDDVAKSFLQSQPKERKAELEAAIAQSQHLDQSQVSSEDGDGMPELGVGNAISLPGFLSEFLKGVVDRIEVKVQNVVLDLDLKIDLPSEGSARSDEPDVVTIRLSVETIALDGVTSLLHNDSSRWRSREFRGRQALYPPPHHSKWHGAAHFRSLSFCKSCPIHCASVS